MKVRKHWLSMAFVLGFFADNITLNRVDQLFDNIVLTSYVLLAMISIFMLYAGTAGKLPESITPFAKKYIPLLAQFSFGGLLSGMLIFYGRSGSWIKSWPFLLIILVIIYGNETVRDRAQRLIFNISVLFIGLFSYVVLVIPVVTGKMGAWVFVGSGLVAVIIMYWFIQILRKIVPNFIKMHLRSIVFTVGSIYATFNMLYFTNIIPPIPLSLKEVGVYHNVIHFDDGRYQLTYEKPEWWQFFRNSDKNFVYQSGDTVYCFASVFAPTRLTTDIYHKWEKYDEAAGVWREHSKLSYPIAGGRGGGFRGFTFISNYSDGVWRCTVETGRGQVLGSETFEIYGGERKELVTRVE